MLQCTPHNYSAMGHTINLAREGLRHKTINNAVFLYASLGPFVIN